MKNHAESILLTMKHVERLAIKTLRKCKFKTTQDNINEVMTAIWRAYTRYDSTKKIKLFTWLIHCARCKIKSLKNKRPRKITCPMISLDTRFTNELSWHDLLGKQQFDKLELDEIFEYARSDVFTEQQKEIFKRVYIYYEEISSIAIDMNLGRTNVYNILNQMLRKLRWKFGN